MGITDPKGKPLNLQRVAVRSEEERHLTAYFVTAEVYEKPGQGQGVRDALEARGHKVWPSGAWSLGSNAAIVVDPASGVLHAGADPRVEACALAR
jgi:gamma-glutamyltranspeptidase